MLNNFDYWALVTAIGLINESDVRHVKWLARRACDIKHVKWLAKRACDAKHAKWLARRAWENISNI